MTESVGYLFSLVLAAFLSLSDCADPRAWNFAVLQAGHPIALRAVNETLQLYRLATDDEPRLCRRSWWIRSSTDDLFTWKEDEKEFLGDSQISYLEGGITANKNVTGLLVLAGQMERSLVSCEAGLPSEQKKELGVFSATDDIQLRKKLELSKPVTENGTWSFFEVGGETFWAFNPDLDDTIYLRKISVNKNIVEWRDYGNFSFFQPFIPWKIQVVELEAGVHLLSALVGLEDRPVFTQHYLGKFIDNGDHLQFNRMGTTDDVFDYGLGARQFLFTKLGSAVFAVGGVTIDRRKSSANEAWRNDVTLVRKIELERNGIIQKPVGLHGAKASEFKELVKRTTPLQKNMSFSFENEGTSVLNLTFQHSANFKGAGYDVALWDGIDDKEVIHLIFNKLLNAEVKEYTFAVSLPDESVLGDTEFTRSNTLSGNVLAIIGQDVIELYLEGGKYVMTANNYFSKLFTNVTISPLEEESQITLKEASYWTFGPNGKSSNEAVDAAAGRVDDDDSGSSGSTFNTPAALPSDALHSVPSAFGPSNTQSTDLTTTIFTKTTFGGADLATATLTKRTSDSANLAIPTLTKTTFGGGRVALSWVYSIACLTI